MLRWSLYLVASSLCVSRFRSVPLLQLLGSQRMVFELSGTLAVAWTSLLLVRRWMFGHSLSFDGLLARVLSKDGAWGDVIFPQIVRPKDLVKVLLALGPGLLPSPGFFCLIWTPSPKSVSSIALRVFGFLETQLSSAFPRVAGIWWCTAWFSSCSPSSHATPTVHFHLPPLAVSVVAVKLQVPLIWKLIVQ